MTDQCSPGSHPHADQPNWEPAETFEEYLANSQEGLEAWSERRVAQLLGMSRVQVWRLKMKAAIPEDLFEMLLADARAAIMEGKQPIRSKELAKIGRAFATGTLTKETECCPNCGYVLRERRPWGKRSDKVIQAWLARQAADRDARTPEDV